MVVVDEGMDTRPICDTRLRLRVSGGENGYCLALFGQPNVTPSSRPRLSQGHKRLHKGTEEQSQSLRILVSTFQ